MNSGEFLVGFAARDENSFVVVTSEHIFVINGSRSLSEVVIGAVFSMTVADDGRTLNLEMIDKTVGAFHIDTGSEANARSLTRMFKYVRRRQRRMRHLQ